MRWTFGERHFSPISPTKFFTGIGDVNSPTPQKVPRPIWGNWPNRQTPHFVAEVRMYTDAPARKQHVKKQLNKFSA